MALRYTRVLLKLSGEALAGREPYGIDPGTVSGFCAEIAEVVRLGAQVALVIGGGNIFRGMAASAKGMDRAHDKALETKASAEEAIKENPLQAIAIAAGLGLLIGILTRR